MAVVYRLATFPEVYADSGNPMDIQAAIAEAQAIGGRVYVLVPNGDYTWHNETVVIPGDIVVFGNDSIIRTTTPAPHNTFFRIEAGNKRARIASFSFYGLVTSSNDDVAGNAIRVWTGIDFRIDNCKFTDFPSAAISVGNPYTSLTQPKGVIDHNLFDNPYKATYGGVWGYGIVVAGPIPLDTPWTGAVADITSFLGKYETIPDTCPVVYAEDNTFRRCRHTPDATQGGWFVSRHNLYDGGQYVYSVCCHASTRGMEVYDNIIDCSNSIYEKRAIGFRGGGGVVFNNIIRNAQTGVRFIWEQPPNSQKEPQDIWLWNNTLENTPEYIQNSAGLVENEEYFLRAPNQGQDGFTYTPYPYPHPLTLEGEPPPPPPSQGTTPFLGQLNEGVYEISVPSVVTVTPDTYNFKQWNDGDTNPTKTVNLTSDISLTAIYEKAIGLATLRGIVKDNKGSPIADADVSCNGVATKTLADGSYEFKDLENRPYTITISKAGYQSITMQADASSGGTINLPEVALSPTPSILPGLSLLGLAAIVLIPRR